MSTAPQTAADVMTASPRTCSPYSTVLEAVMVFRDADCGAVPIVDNGKAVGILTDRDVALALTEFPDLPGRAVADIMSKDPITVPADTTLLEIEATFAAKRVGRLLVVDKAGALIGIISLADIARREPASEIARVISDVVITP
jgi:CBS domain-containing protein